jgi:phage terminase large subunit GpA-like protein
MSTNKLPSLESPAADSGKTDELVRAWRQGQTPTPRMSVPQWADTFRFLAAEAGSTQGKWSTSRVEVARGAMLAVTEPGVHTITAMVCTQLMKTALLENIFGYFAHLDPCPILLLQPKEEAAQQFSKERISPMLRVTPVLRELVGTVKTRNAEETLLYKAFPGGFLALAGAGSPDNVARRPIRVLLADEIDKYAFTREGNTIILAEERTATFGLNWLSVRACSPTVEDESLIQKSYAESDQRRASIECPHCGHRQFPDFFRHVHWQKTESGQHLPKTAALHCESCGAAWSEGQRLNALATIRWHQCKPFECCGTRQAPLDLYDRAWRGGAAAPADVPWDWWQDKAEGRYAVYRAKCHTCGTWPVDNVHAGFQSGKLLSPWQKDKPADIAAKWLLAKGDPDAELAWWNTQMGLPHRPTGGKALAVDALLARREVWSGQVAPGVGVLTVGVDVQDYRIELELVGWGRDEESWSLAYEVIEGEFSDPMVQAKLDAYLLQKFSDEAGRQYRIMAACVDSGGHHTNAVYEFSKARLGRHIWAIKGASERDGARNPVWPTKRPSRRNKASFRPVLIGGNTARDQVRNRLLLDHPGEAGPRAGYMHFPVDRDFGYFEQLTADRIELKEVAGRKFRLWVTPSGKANEAADCRVYAYAALCGLNHLGLRLNNAVARAELAAPESVAQHVAEPVAAAEPQKPTAPMSLVQVQQQGVKKTVASRLA